MGWIRCYLGCIVGYGVVVVMVLSGSIDGEPMRTNEELAWS